ncbi:MULTISPECIES: potassium channel family protein [Haloarcula]|uniref:Potassium transporter Trk n=1 Tax=Haloarcula pellucida TaxID=1427151 RepID=A0A830GS60_9EURY|nr:MULTISPECIES: TrkA family potassium uptake protein [Halomicroarcula]MBX0349589.1 TrkA family potassium uptake protein [Halomicroarcula pellucida]MDS0278827.1 TrkA family potassium uptake protein [Halomicroarcula sp. S1AR25-4]GGO02232.1 potassium transporter Trk [Halomicroarcula pellucida]
MKFVIVGYGRVGTRTARILQSEGHNVVIVEREPEKVDRARDDGFTVVAGDGSEESVLEEAGIDTADAIGGLTGDLNTNFTACMIGKEHGCRTVLRIDADYREEIYEKYAADVDEIIYPERLGAAGAKTALLGGDFNVLADLTERLSIASVEVPEGSPVIGKRVVEVELPGDAHIYAHGSSHEPMTIPLPQTVIEAGDSVAVMAAPDGLDDVRASLKGGT